MITQQASLMSVIKEMPDASPSKRRYTLNHPLNPLAWMQTNYCAKQMQLFKPKTCK